MKPRSASPESRGVGVGAETVTPRPAHPKPAPVWMALMYHDVLARTAGAMDHFAVPVDRFREHLLEIEAAGYRGVSLGTAVRGDVEHPVAITFDDATSSQVEEALPCLVERGMTATFFAVTGWVGRSGYASWDQLRELKAQGMEVQSHTHSHPFLSELGRSDVELELRRSRDLLNEHLDQSTSILALPGGDFPSRAALSVIADVGYEIVATSIYGRNAMRERGSPRFIRRCTVRGDGDGAALQKVLAGDAVHFWRQQLREGVLRNLRRSLGPTRYARWRRRFLGAISRTR